MASAGSSSPRRQPATPGTIHVELLDGFRLRLGDNEIRLAPQSERLVAFLALAGRPVDRHYVAGKLWFDGSDTRVAARLRSALWRLKDVGASIVATSRTRLALFPGTVVDACIQTETARRALDSRIEVRRFDPAPLFAGDLLPGWYDDWVVLEREQRTELRLHALATLALRFVDAGRYAEALTLSLAAVSADPVRESAHRAVISAYLAEGNVASAAAQYRRYADVVRRIGIEPSGELRKLVEAR